MGELGLGGKPHLSRDTRLLAPLVVSHPFSRQIQFPIEEGGANGADIAEKNADLTILHLLGTWVVLPLDSNRVLTLLGKPRIIKSKDRLRIAESVTVAQQKVWLIDMAQAWLQLATKAEQNRIAETEPI